MKKFKNTLRLLLLASAAILAGSAAFGDNVYRSISPDGRKVYSDHPPSTGKIQEIYSFENLPASPVPEGVQRYRRELEKSMDKRLAAKATPTAGAQLYVASWCGYCRKAKAYLGEKGIPY